MEPLDRIEVTNWVDDFKQWLNEPVTFHKKWHFMVYMAGIAFLLWLLPPGWIWTIF